MFQAIAYNLGQCNGIFVKFSASCGDINFLIPRKNYCSCPIALMHSDRAAIGFPRFDKRDRVALNYDVQVLVFLAQ